MTVTRSSGPWPAFTAARICKIYNLLRQSRRGTTALELALVLPVLLTMIFGVEETGRLFWTQSALQYAVARAARCAAINVTTCGSSSQIATYASSQVPGITVPSSAFTASSPSCGHEVTASYRFSAVVPQLVPLSGNLTAISCHP